MAASALVGPPERCISAQQWLCACHSRGDMRCTCCNLRKPLYAVVRYRSSDTQYGCACSRGVGSVWCVGDGAGTFAMASALCGRWKPMVTSSCQLRMHGFLQLYQALLAFHRYKAQRLITAIRRFAASRQVFEVCVACIVPQKAGARSCGSSILFSVCLFSARIK